MDNNENLIGIDLNLDINKLLATNFKILLNEADHLKILNRIIVIKIINFNNQDGKSFIVSYMNNLEEKLHFHILIGLRKLISDMDDDYILDNEFKVGIKLLINHSSIIDTMSTEFFNILFTYLKKKLIVDEYFIIKILNTILFSNNHFKFNSNLNASTQSTFFIDKCFDIVFITFEKNLKNLSSSFWELIIENSFRINKNHFIKVLNIYPVKQFFSEKIWREIINCNMTDLNINYIFELFIHKYFISSQDEKFSQFFENIFNIFIEEICKSFDNIEFKKIEEIYFSILKKLNVGQQNLNDSNLEIIFEQIIAHKINYENFSNILIFTCTEIIKKSSVKKLIDKVIRMLYKKGDIFSIYNIIKLYRCKKIGGELVYEDLILDEKILNSVINFLMESTDLIIYQECKEEFNQLTITPTNLYKKYSSQDFTTLDNLNFLK